MSSTDTKQPTGSNPSRRGGLGRDVTGTKEAVFGFACGVLYGITSPLVGQPLDTVKTKMQAQGGYMSGGMVGTFKNVIRNEGVLALYKGLLPPLVGSAIFRSIQFGVYNSAYANLKTVPGMTTNIPGTFGVETRVIAAGLLSATCRSLIESPLELIKVRRQLGQTWDVKSLYQGYGVTWMRTTGLMTTFFILEDSLVRHAPELINTPGVGPFLKGSICATGIVNIIHQHLLNLNSGVVGSLAV
ncbi:mitochondrial substrate carrier family protein L [Acrasis kona]|uniref:Mitochondrial substrate carrier family protein L n=1 Tax=Acrasis kona TaxID=1008807 RepID=A0AAW2ZD33_9EUKA